MFEWINTLQAWLQGWLSAEAGLWGLFFSAFVSATLLPGSSEVVMTALVTAYPDVVWWAFLAATAGNVTGCVLSYGMGYGARQGFERFQRVKVDLEHPLVQRLRRYGPPALFLSFLPLVGDLLVVAAGWLKLPLGPSMLWIAAGKATRYLMLVLGLLGVLSFA
ncbi:MAG: VTT domain-containing protein [Rhodobacteraceae bacterium]|jgi:membrane protein YqaA with SNARE-associated domain|nr:VTT domain-containing protein [Burkholderiaceae bacterium]MCZ8151214.1 VTT domain-containing protein [Paracoccaceae bacterium]MCZ8177092.1 VTT domain-containing protein [Burkholderiaceae bacterium]